MEAFEQSALNTTTYKPLLYKHYVDDTLLIWSHGLEKFHEFMIFLNSWHDNIKFIMELEQGGALPFRDILTMRRTDSTLERGVLKTHIYQLVFKSIEASPSSSEMLHDDHFVG